MKKIIVTAGVLKNNDTYLCTQRAESKLPYISKKFEFPGGKVEEGESLELCLQRELKEELNIEVIVNKSDYLMEVIHRYPDFELTMHVFLLPTEIEQVELKEHIKAIWLSVDRLGELDWAMADIPIVERLCELHDV